MLKGSNSPGQSPHISMKYKESFNLVCDESRRLKFLCYS